MFPATCSECGKATELPFEPRDGRPVYCRECYSRVKPSPSRY
jgi:CxxC-x17-CxxC domain-containing protein